MGCDIHLFTEVKRKINGKDTWVCSDRFKLNQYFGEEGEGIEYDVENIFSSRNYRLFSMLANVRNYSENTYIFEPRGIPSDLSKKIIEQNEYWEGDGHSHSWATLKELKEFSELNKITKYSGYMTPQDAELVDSGKMPESWWMGGDIPNQVYREWEHGSDTMKELIDSLQERKNTEFWTRNDDPTKKDDEFRIVFWFDN